METIDEIRKDRDYLEAKIKMLRNIYEGLLGNNTTDFHRGYDAAAKGFIEVLSELLERKLDR